MMDYGFEDRTIGRLLDLKAETLGSKVYLLSGEQRITYHEMRETANRVANSLLDLNIKKGDKVCLIMQNSVEFLYAWFALAKIGAIMVPLNPALKGGLLRYMVDNSDSSAIIVDADLVDRVAFIQEGLEKVGTVIPVPALPREETGLDPGFRVKSFAGLYRGSPANPDVRVRFFEPMSILYTSGTTGPSKGAVLSHAHYYSVGRQVNRYMAYDRDSVVYTCLPLFHANGSMLGALGALLAEGSFALGKRFSLSRFWDEVRAYGATHTSVVGSVFPLLWGRPPGPEDADNPMKFMKVTPWAPEFSKFAERFGLELITAFGATEIGIACVSPLGEEIRPGSCGKALEAYEIRIFDNHDLEVPAGSTGEIVVRGLEPYAQMEGYYRMPEATLSSFRNLWYHTGDYGYQDEDGYLYFVDRKKDAIRRRGENISSFEVEEVLNSHPRVRESAVVAVPSELGEDEVKAVVVLKPGATLSPEELIAHCEDRLAYFAVPRYLQFMERLPKTPTLRVEKYKLRAPEMMEDTWDREKAGYQLKR